MKIFIIAVLTADGFLGRDDAHRSTLWTSKEDAQFFQERTKQAGAIVLGRKTFDTFKKPLPGRKHFIYSRSPLGLDDPQVEHTNDNPAELVKKVASQGYSELAVCGGASIYTMFLKAGVVDTLYLTVEPQLFGQGLPLFNQEIDMKLHLKDLKRLSDQTTLFEYQVIK